MLLKTKKKKTILVHYYNPFVLETDLMSKCKLHNIPIHSKNYINNTQIKFYNFDKNYTDYIRGFKFDFLFL